VSIYAINRDGAQFKRLTGPDGAIAAMREGDTIWMLPEYTFNALYILSNEDLEKFARMEQEDPEGYP
jgi:hypothetical protein